MSAWWNDLSQREKSLIMIAGALAGVLFLTLAVIRPMSGWREDASRSADRARDSFELVASAAAIAGNVEVSATQNQTPLRQAITSSASSNQIELLRIGAENDGQIEVQLGDINGDQLFDWFSLLERQFGITVTFADISSNADGIVSAQVLVLERR